MASIKTGHNRIVANVKGIGSDSNVTWVPATVFNKRSNNVVVNYNPNHDQQGKFTSSGAVSSLLKTEKGMKSFEGPGTFHGTLADHTGENGKLTPARQALHTRIVNEAVAKAPVSDTPTVTMMGGGPASGKSTLIKLGMVDNKGMAHVDSDELKGKLPEYNRLVAAKDKDAAGYAHEESSLVAKKITATALQQGKNVMMDGTGDSGIDHFMKKVASWKAGGAKRIVGEYVTCPTNEAVDRAVARGIKTGRVVDPNVIRGIHAQVSRILPEAIKRGAFDEVRLWDTSRGMADSPAADLVMSHSNGVTKIHDHELWKAFLKKGNEKLQ